jgi:DNA-binding HxlR family transcriptional regulator
VRSYEQYCSVAKALDVVGDRWSLLIVRELLLRGPCRYTDLQYGLPGIATNLLADRLRELEEAGVVERIEEPPPIAATVYRLTPRGKELAPVVQALGQWGADLMIQVSEDEEFRSHWLAFPVAHSLVDRDPGKSPITIEVRTGDRPMLIESRAGGFRARPGTVEKPDAIVAGSPDVVLGLLTGRLSLAQARKRGLRLQGDTAVIQRIGSV